jgi:hypothetical protein
MGAEADPQLFAALPVAVLPTRIGHNSVRKSVKEEQLILPIVTALRRELARHGLGAPTLATAVRHQCGRNERCESSSCCSARLLIGMNGMSSGV